MSHQYGPSVYGIILRIVQNKETAEEVLQNTLLKVWNKIEQYDESKGTLFTWVSIVARNSALDTIRLKRYKAFDKTDSIEDSVSKVQAIYTDHSSIDVEKITKILDDKYKVIIDKLYLEGYSQSDLAEELGIPLGTVKTRLRKAISLLRENLKKDKKVYLGVFIISLLVWFVLCQ